MHRRRGIGDDEIFGSAAAETIDGKGGDDDITGGAGRDVLKGNTGVDHLIATDGVVDDAINCGDGAGEIAAIDADDPEPSGCETVQRAGGNGGGGDGGGGDGSDERIDVPVTGTIAASLIRAKMPNVVGETVDDARNAIAKKFDAISFDIDYVKKCKRAKDLEVVKQSPAPGKKANGTVVDPVVAALDVCLGDQKFLDDCDTKDLKKDVKPLAGKLDGGLALHLTRKLAKCKTDYDVKIKKKADDETVRLATQPAAGKKKRKGEIKLAIDCPAESDLIASVGEGWKGTTKLTFGPRINGEKPDLWTLPAPYKGTGATACSSFVTLTVRDTAGQWPEVRAVVDDDQVNQHSKKSDLYKSRNGTINIPVTTTRPGKLRICVFQETSGPELLTKAIEIDVVEGLKAGSGEVWKTAGNRYIKFKKDGPTEVTPKEAGIASRRAGVAEFNFGFCLANLGDCLGRVFNGRSHLVNEAAAETNPVEREKKITNVTKKAQLGVAQIAIGPKLKPDPATPLIEQRPCIVFFANVYYQATCPTIVAPGGAAIVGANFGGNGIVAAGAGNILSHNGGAIVAAGAGNLIGADGATLIGADGATLIGPDGATLIGADGATMVAAKGLNGTNGLVAAGGLNAISPDTAGIVAGGGLNLIGPDGASLVAAGAGNLIGMDGATLVAAGGLN